jgi:hypothetical protein
LPIRITLFTLPAIVTLRSKITGPIAALTRPALSAAPTSQISGCFTATLYAR